MDLAGGHAAVRSRRLGSGLLQGRWLADRLPVVAAVPDPVLFPLVLLGLGGLTGLAVRTLGLDGATAAIRTATLALVYVAGGWLVARLIESILAARTEALSERIPKLMMGVIHGAFMFVGPALFLWSQDLSFTGVRLSTGVAAAVLGLALQRTLGDLFSGIALGIERPFNLGDWIELSDGTVGQVIDTESVWRPRCARCASDALRRSRPSRRPSCWRSRDSTWPAC
ncbi:mechanosensitive ion channel family protein [Allochromatium tepidum]|uniref:Small-conductance mechanosensitive channel n=1 Tax=Allochromatium tepidum TaxID=553982 RepID=A0ABM7QIC9_9GAMM|nr:mechanosensitive ion channel family protein [Allochromatium tepidum]BCU05527.1 hypothetical protein Atep_02040 [Allochromatium tepidum]